jgi:hypothetical protein
MNEGAKDVTRRILDRHIIYGASDSTKPAYSSSNKSLNYAEGGSINSPQKDRVTIIPFKINYQDTVGLFGKENHFIRVDVAINPDYAFACFEETGWECAQMTAADLSAVNTYFPAEVDEGKDLTTVNTYEPANFRASSLGLKPDAFISVDLKNLKTGNKYIDAWFDVRLYTKDRQEHPYDKMYVHLNDFFYIGFHARNTRRLPYNVQCVIGQEYLSGLELGANRYINRA